jgi:hypothetical protein
LLLLLLRAHVTDDEGNNKLVSTTRGRCGASHPNQSKLTGLRPFDRSKDSDTRRPGPSHGHAAPPSRTSITISRPAQHARHPVRPCLHACAAERAAMMRGSLCVLRLARSREIGGAAQFWRNIKIGAVPWNRIKIDWADRARRRSHRLRPSSVTAAGLGWVVCLCCCRRLLPGPCWGGPCAAHWRGQAQAKAVRTKKKITYPSSRSVRDIYF